MFWNKVDLAMHDGLASKIRRHQHINFCKTGVLYASRIEPNAAARPASTSELKLTELVNAAPASMSVPLVVPLPVPVPVPVPVPTLDEELELDAAEELELCPPLLYEDEEADEEAWDCELE